MGKVLETLTQTGRRITETRTPVEKGSSLEVVEESPPELGDDVPFIEVGGKHSPQEGSPDVLGSRPGVTASLPLPSVTEAKRLPRLVAPAGATETLPLTVQFRPLAASLA